MKRLRAFLFKLAGLFNKERRERELADEIESHLQLHIEDNLRAGMSPELARRHALVSLGSLESAKESYRAAATLPAVESLLQDVTFSVRQLRKNPGFTFTAIVMLALGLCSSVAIFAFVDAALIKPLPYQDSSRLVGVYETVPIFPRSNLSYLDYLDWKRLNNVFSSLDVYQRTGHILTTSAGAQIVRGARVSDGFFRTLGVSPILGRDFYDGEDLPAAPRTLLLTYEAWQNRYGAKEDVIGQAVTLDGKANTIIGVLPAGFHFAPVEPAEFWTTLHRSGSCDDRRSCHNLYGVARLKDGVTLGTALADVKLIAQRLEEQYPETNRDQGAALVSLSEVIVGDVRPILLVLLGGAGLLLLIATVNVSSLLLVRSEGRKREIAVRSALGASPGRLVRLFVTEGIVLVIASGSLGLMGAWWLVHLLARLIPPDMLGGLSFLRELSLNGRVMGFGGTISLLAAVLFSTVPTLRLSLSEVRQGLAESSRGSSGTMWRRLGSKLVVIELATAVVLLAGAGLFGKSLYRLLHVEIGMQPENVFLLQLSAPMTGYDTNAKTIALHREVFDRIAALPGVTYAGSTSNLPVSHNGNTIWFWIGEQPRSSEHNEVAERTVSPDLFSALGARMLRGRPFAESDDASKLRVGIINNEMEKQFFAGEDPIGKQLLYLEESMPISIQIVGVVEDIKEGQLDTATPPVLYLPFKQDPDSDFGIVVRTSQSANLIPEMSGVIRSIDPSIVTFGGKTLADRISDSRSAYMHRSSAWLVGGFAAVALLLSVVGLYGVIAYSVSQRTREIGVRMALGAQPASVYALILREAGGLSAVGIGAGLICSLAAAILSEKLLFGIQWWDVPTLAAVALVLAIASLIAGYIPARRAASVNPVQALRSE